MDIRKLQRAIVDGLEDVKAQNIVVFNTQHLSPLFERVIIASGTSNRQTKALAASVRDAVKAAGGPPPRMEGEANGEWIIVDCGPAVVHVMQPAFRDYYHLEELWGDKPVRMKLAGEPQVGKRFASDAIEADRSAAHVKPAVATRAPKTAAAPSKPPPSAKRAAKRTGATSGGARGMKPARAPAKAPAKHAARRGAGGPTSGAPHHPSRSAPTRGSGVRRTSGTAASGRAAGATHAGARKTPARGGRSGR
jgi:ribosome-associated protein